MKTKLLPRITALAQRAHDSYKELQKPDANWNFKVLIPFWQEIETEIEAINKAAGPGLVVGRCLSFGVADGSANYIVTKVRKNDVAVQWIPVLDFYSSPVVGLSRDKSEYIILRSTAERYCGF